MNKNFYHRFEAVHRGSRELIKSRLQVYLPFIQPLSSLYPKSPAVDVGCGRGEWLELLTESGFSAVGVDLDPSMLETCQQLGLKTTQQDAIEYLKSLPDDSQMLVSGFHIAEHIPFDDLKTLIQQALRVLKPAGLLILETPNPENIVVGSSAFYLDPTHNKPIPLGLLAFLPQYFGYAKTKVLRLQESPELRNDDKLSLLQVLQGVSPDYAVVAQKDANEALLATTAFAFEQEYGVSLELLATRYEARIALLASQAQEANTKAESAENKARQAQEIAQRAEDASAHTENKVQMAIEKVQQNTTLIHQLEAKFAIHVEIEAAKHEVKIAQEALNTAHADKKILQIEVKAAQAAIETAKTEIKMLETELESSKLQNDEIWQQKEQERVALHQTIENLQSHIDKIYRSRSWKMTRPFRKTLALIRKIYQPSEFSHDKSSNSSVEVIDGNQKSSNSPLEVIDENQKSSNSPLEVIDWNQKSSNSPVEVTDGNQKSSNSPVEVIDWSQYSLSTQRTYQQLLKFAKESDEHENCY